MSQRFNDYDYMLKLIIIGDPSVGKSSLLLRYVDDIYEESYICTIGVDFKIKTLEVSGKKVKLQIWDTAGQERFKPITQTYFRGAHGCIVVYDISDADTFTNLNTWIREYKEINNPEYANNIVILGNKCDLEDKRQVTFDKGQRLGEELGVPFKEVSAKNNTSVNEAFYTIAEDVISKLRTDDVKSEDRQSFFKIAGTSIPGEEEVSAQERHEKLMQAKKKKKCSC